MNVERTGGRYRATRSCWMEGAHHRGISGIGRELSLQGAKAGARVLATGRDNNALLELAAEATRNNGECQTLPGDITNAGFRSELLAFAEDKMGGLDGLVNNAGQGTWNHVRGGDEATFRSIMETNFLRPLN